MRNLIVYKIFCKDNNIKDIYIGSSINYHKRIMRHKNNCNNENNEKYNIFVYKKIREYGGFDNWTFETIEECEYDDERKREQYWINELNPSLNIKKKVCRTLFSNSTI